MEIKNNSVVSQFQENKLTQFFVQDGKKIEIPGPKVEGITQETADITPELCTALFQAFDDRDRFAEVGGFDAVNTALNTPMVLVMSIWDDVCYPSPPSPSSSFLRSNCQL